MIDKDKLIDAIIRLDQALDGGLTGIRIDKDTYMAIETMFERYTGVKNVGLNVMQICGKEIREQS